MREQHSNEHVEHVIQKLEKYIEVQENKKWKLHRSNMEKENRLCKTTVSGMKNSWARTCKEMSIDRKINSYKGMVQHLSSLAI